MRNINIQVHNDHTVNFENDYAGLNLENMQGTITFNFDNFIQGQARAEIIIDDLDGYVLLDQVEETYTLPIKSSLLTGNNILMQLVITQPAIYEKTADTQISNKKTYYEKSGNNYVAVENPSLQDINNYYEAIIPIWKSEEFYLEVGASINATETIPEQYPTWIDTINNLINETTQALENIDNALEQVNTAIEETNNLNIDVSKEDTTTTIELTKKDGTTKEVEIEDGEDLQFKWEGTSLGVKTSSQSTYQYVDLQGVQGETGPMGSPFTIAKTYSTEAQMIADYDNMQVGDYVMIDGDIELQENATLWVKEETPAPTTKWHYLADFSGASGIQGETGATPNIQIGTVTSGSTPSVTRTGTNENPVLNFVLQKGDKGDTGNTGPTGNGISNIEKTAETSSQKDYRINYTNGEHFDYSVENGEVTQAQLDEVIAENDYLNSIIDQIVPKTTATGTTITLDDTLQAKMNMSLSSSELEQETTTGKNKLPYTSDFSNTTNGITFTGNNGVYTIKGTTSSSVQAFTGYLALNGEYTIQSGDYLHLMNNAVGSSDAFILQFTDSNSYSPTLSTANRILDLSSYVGKTINKIGLYVAPSTTTDVKLTPMIVNSATATDFEEFTGGNPAPNPDFPMEIHTISGDNTIKVVGKNLAQSNWASDFVTACNNANVYLATKDNRSCVRYNSSAGYGDYEHKNLSLGTKFKENTQYTISYDILKESNNDRTIAFYYTDGTYTPNTNLSSLDTWTHQTLTSQAGKTVKYIAPFYTLGATYIDLDTWQIEEGTTASTYTPYQEQTAQVNLGDLEYSKIGNYEDKFIRNSGKNLANIDDITIGRAWNNSFNSSRATIQAIPLERNKQYTLVSSWTNSHITQIRAAFYVDYNNVQVITNFPYTNTSYDYLSIEILADTTFTSDMLNGVEILFCEGSATINDYEPYGNGNWYLKKNIGKGEVNSSSLDTFTNSLTNLNSVQFVKFNDDLKKVSLNRAIIMLCNKLSYSTRSGGTYDDSTLINKILDGGVDKYWIGLPKTITTLEEAQTYLGTLEVCYPLATPTYTLLNDTLQSQLDTIESMLLSYKGQTNISQINNDLPFIMTSTALKEL